MKKILSVLLASLLLLSTSATAFAMETETNADNWLVSANQHKSFITLRLLQKQVKMLL